MMEFEYKIIDVADGYVHIGQNFGAHLTQY